jgi:hypothetical protein
MPIRNRRPYLRTRRRRLLVSLVLAGLVLAIATPLALGVHRFPDVTNPQTHDAIDRVVDAGIMTSCDGTNFCPQQALGRQWAALNYDRILGLDGTARPFTPTFRDVNIETGGGTAPLAVDSTIRVDNLNADRVDGFDANALVRAAQASGGTVDDFNTCADTNLATLTVNAPQAGIILIWSKVAWRWDPNSTPASARAILEDKVRVDGTVAVSGTTDTTNTDVFEISSQSTAVPVTAGAHTLVLQATECGNAMAFVDGSNVMTLFVPFGNSGSQGALSGR